MAKFKGQVVIDVENCKGCELCNVTCPQETLKLSNTINKKGYRYAVVVNEDCNGCANCATICPDFAITVYKKKLD